MWLPEPLLPDTAAAASEHALLADSLSLAFPIRPASLSPGERAAFPLPDAVGSGDDASARIEGRRPRFETSPAKRAPLARAFFAAVERGDTEGLIRLLADDVAVCGDGGGKAPSRPPPLAGRDRVSRLLAGIGRQMREFGLSSRLTALNGQPGAMALAPDGRLTHGMVLDIAGDAIQAVHAIINPDTPGHLGPVADVHGPLRDRREQAADRTI